VRLLRSTAAHAEYPDDQQQLYRIGAAIRLGFDFYHITRVLTEERVDAIAEDLRRALKGTLEDVGPTAANRAQSQALIGAVLAVGGLRPAAPVLGNTPTPDYIAHLDGLRYGVEVKRPESNSQTLKRVDQAIDQIAAFEPEAGLIVVDLSDSLFEGGFEINLDRTVVEPLFQREYRRISDHIERSKRPGIHRLANLFVFANLLGWERTPTPVPNSLFPTYSEVFHRARAGLISDQSLRVREKIEDGFQAFQAKLETKRRVDWRSS
jgi:hypothetical protein